jgi:hypothetical protein
MIPRMATDPVAVGSDHTGAEFVKYLERRLVAVQAKLPLELDRRHAERMARNEVAAQNQIDNGVRLRSMTVPAVSALSR